MMHPCVVTHSNPNLTYHASFCDRTGTAPLKNTANGCIIVIYRDIVKEANT